MGTPAGTSLLVPARQTPMVWRISTLTSMMEERVSYCVILGRDVTTSAGPNQVRNVKCTLFSLKIVTLSEEPEVLRTPGVPFASLCQDLLTVQGSILKAVYFSYDKSTQDCTMYTSMEMDCDIIGGPKPGPEIYTGK